MYTCERSKCVILEIQYHTIPVYLTQYIWIYTNATQSKLRTSLRPHPLLSGGGGVEACWYSPPRLQMALLHRHYTNSTNLATV